jgi:MSHA biogenesis protein MshJ
VKAWSGLAAKIDGRTARERAILFGVLLIALYALADLALFAPQARERKQIELKMSEYRRRITLSEDVLNQAVVRADPAALARQRLEAAQQVLVARSRALEGLSSRLIPPQEMPKILQALSQRQTDLRLIGLRTLDAQAVGALAAAQPGGLYRHGVELTLEGGYAGFASYLERLERMPYGVYWGGLELDATAYPKLTLKLTLYTLSQDKAWLAV